MRVYSLIDVNYDVLQCGDLTILIQEPVPFYFLLFI